MYRIAIALAFATTAFGQAPVFEVASLKPAAPVTGHQQFHMTMKSDHDRVEFINASLLDLIHTAYRVNAQLVKGPDWMNTQKFDVLAKLPDTAAHEQVPDMLQALLADRFHLSVRRVQQVSPCYALVVGKGGAKLTPAAPGSDGANWSRTFTVDGTMHIEAKKMTAPALAELVASFLGYPVVDRTGLTGEYDVPLDFSPDDLSTGSIAAGIITQGAGDDRSGSSIPASLQRAGLKLESQKLPLDVVVVDRLDKFPTAN